MEGLICLAVLWVIPYLITVILSTIIVVSKESKPVYIKDIHNFLMKADEDYFRFVPICSFIIMSIVICAFVSETKLYKRIRIPMKRMIRWLGNLRIK